MYDIYDDFLSKVFIGFKGPDYNLNDIAAIAVNLIIGVGFATSLLMLTIAIVMFITSAGNPDKAKVAHRAIAFSIISGVISLLIVTIKFIVLNTLGVSMPELVNTNANFYP